MAQKKDFIEEYVYTAGDRDSKDICYDIAKTRLRSMLLDKVGVYIKSETILKTSEINGRFNQDFFENISSISAGISEFKVLDQSWNGAKYWMKAVVTIDTTSLRQLVINKQKENELDDLKEQVAMISRELNLSKSVKQSSTGEFYTRQLIVAEKGEQFLTLCLSKSNNRLFVSTTKGRMVVLDKNDSIVKVLKFSNLGQVTLDYVGDFGAYTDENGTAYLFNQKTLNVFDTVRISNSNQGALKIWFTKSGILISSFKNIYKYTLGHQVVTWLQSYSILDYDYQSNKILLGYWDRSLFSDRKIREIFYADASNLMDKTLIMTTERSFEIYSILTDNASNVISYDGKGNYYSVNTYTGKRTTVIQDTIQISSKKTFGLAKIEDNEILVVRYDAIKMNAHNIKRYNIRAGDHPCEFIFKNGKSGVVTKSMIMLQPVYDNQIVKNDVTNTIYYLTVGINNKLISIR